MSGQPLSGREIARQYAIGVPQQQAMMDESSSDVVLQGLMVDDSELKRILKGDVLEPLNTLAEYVVLFDKAQAIDHAQAERIGDLLEKINARMVKFQRLIPYQILLSPLMRLTNIDEKAAKLLKLRISLMIGRDLLDINEDELEMADVNFYDALELACFNAVSDSTKGWKANVVTEQRKIIKTTIEEARPKGKGIRSRLGL